MPIHLVINGDARDFQNAETIVDVLTELELIGRLAVEVNGKIVPRSQYRDFRLHPNDYLEIVRAIGGG